MADSRQKTAETGPVSIQTDLRLWHGGAPGRAKGDLVLPPVRTGLSFTRRQMAIESGQSQIGQRLDRVYVTTDRQLAEAYASLWSLDGVRSGGGSLYQVQAADLEPDEDLVSLPGVSFQAPRATVISVYNPYVRYDRKRSARTLARVLAAHSAAKQVPS